MRKKMKAMLLLLTMLFLLGGTSVMAAQDGNVYDDAGLLTDSEIGTLNEQIGALQEKSGWNVYAVTTADAGGKSATAYEDDFFDVHSPEQKDGVAVLIDMDNREITISTCGEAIRYLTDSRIDSILDDAYSDVSDGAYGACLMTMVAGVADAYDAGIPGGQYNYDTDTGKISRHHELTLSEILIVVLLALATAAIIYSVVVGKYRMHFGNYQYDFHENGNIDLRISEDRFVNEMTTHRRIPRQTSSGGSSHHSSGRSSTHHSSSGRSHGGGSRKF